MDYDLNQPLEPQIDRELARLLCEKLGHQFESERVERIAKDARDIINQGFSPHFAFSEAYHTELDMYGDPQSKCQPIGLMNVLP